MCEVPRRSWRRALKPQRVVLGVAALAALAASFYPWDEPIIRWILLGLGLTALLVVVLFPAIREVELGFPSGVRVKTALHDREQELTQSFMVQRGDFTLYAQLLSPDPALASTLLEAAWAKTAAEWRGPVTPDLRAYVLCVFVHLLESHEKWAGGSTVGEPLATRPHEMPSLTLAERTVVVLHEFAELPVAQIAAITERPVDDVVADLRAAQETVGRRSIEGGAE